MIEEDLVHLEGLIVGLTLPAACDILESFMCDYRVMEIDGRRRVVTGDVDMQRLNLKVRNGKVFGVYRG